MSPDNRQYGRDDVDYATWYSPWMKRLAKNHAREQLQRMAGIKSHEASIASRSHLRAIEATTSMHSQSMRRAHARNVTTAAGDYLIALNGALEIHDLFPEYAA